MLWLADQLWARPERLLLWRAEDTVVPSLIAAADSARDTVIAAKLLRQLAEAFAGEVIDVAGPFGGARATSFDEIASAHDVAFEPVGRRAARRGVPHQLLRRHHRSLGRARRGHVDAVG